jgi:hypothetical protein
LIGKLAELCADSLASDLFLHLCEAGIAWFGTRHHESELGGFYCWLVGGLQDIDLEAIKVDYDALFGNFEAADCSARPFLDLLVLLCASDNFKGRLLAELDQQLQLWNPYYLTSYSHTYCLFFRPVSERGKFCRAATVSATSSPSVDRALPDQIPAQLGVDIFGFRPFKCKEGDRHSLFHLILQWMSMSVKIHTTIICERSGERERNSN